MCVCVCNNLPARPLSNTSFPLQLLHPTLKASKSTPGNLVFLLSLLDSFYSSPISPSQIGSGFHAPPKKQKAIRTYVFQHMRIRLKDQKPKKNNVGFFWEGRGERESRWVGRWVGGYWGNKSRRGGGGGYCS